MTRYETQDKDPLDPVVQALVDKWNGKMGSGLDKVHCREFHSTWHKTMGGLRHTEHLKGAALTVSYMWLSCANWTRCWESCRATWTASLRTSDQRKPIVQICWLTFVGAWAPYCVLCHCAKRCHIPFLVWTLTCGGHDRESTDADIAIVNAGTIRCDRMVAPGPFTVRDLLAFLPIDDAVIVFGACVRRRRPEPAAAFVFLALSVF